MVNQDKYEKCGLCPVLHKVSNYLKYENLIGPYETMKYEKVSVMKHHQHKNLQIFFNILPVTGGGGHLFLLKG